MLSVRHTAALRAPAAPSSRRAVPASRRAVAPVRAFLGLDKIGESFMRIFSPPKDQAPNGNWAGTTSSFTGRIDHHGAGRPFKDGFRGGAQQAPADATAMPAVEEAREKAEGYMDGALQSVMGRNFEGKDAKQGPTTGAEGWKGELHGRNRDGFHLPRK